MDRRDQLDQLDGQVRLHVEGLAQQDLRDRAAVPHVLEVRRSVALEQTAEVEVLVVIRNPVRQVAQRIRRDIDSARAQPVLLAGEERPVVTEDVLDRVGHLLSSIRGIGVALFLIIVAAVFIVPNLGSADGPQC